MRECQWLPVSTAPHEEHHQERDEDNMWAQQLTAGGSQPKLAGAISLWRMSRYTLIDIGFPAADSSFSKG